MINSSPCQGLWGRLSVKESGHWFCVSIHSILMFMVRVRYLEQQFQYRHFGREWQKRGMPVGTVHRNTVFHNPCEINFILTLAACCFHLFQADVTLLSPTVCLQTVEADKIALVRWTCKCSTDGLITVVFAPKSNPLFIEVRSYDTRTRFLNYRCYRLFMLLTRWTALPAQ